MGVWWILTNLTEIFCEITITMVMMAIVIVFNKLHVKMIINNLYVIVLRYTSKIKKFQKMVKTTVYFFKISSLSLLKNNLWLYYYCFA